MKTVKYKDKTETNLMTEGDAPTETPAMANLTLQSNGTTKATYNGKTATTFNVQAADIGAAASSHTHTSAQISDRQNQTADGALSKMGDTVVTSNTLGHWNGAYSGTSSKLAYCNKGAFGTIVTKNTGDYAAASHTHTEYMRNDNFLIIKRTYSQPIDSDYDKINLSDKGYDDDFNGNNSVVISVGLREGLQPWSYGKTSNYSMIGLTGNYGLMFDTSDDIISIYIEDLTRLTAGTFSIQIILMRTSGMIQLT